MEFNKLTMPKHIKNDIEKNIPTDIPLCTRFPPQPSGYLHVGHLFACRLNQSVATYYKGKFLIRFDDTNPEVESDEYTKSIIDDLVDCGFDVSNLSYTSDSFGYLIDKATELVQNGCAYIDFSTQEEMAKQRSQLQGSPDRTNSKEENIKRWQDMLNGTITNGCLRLFAFPDSKNGAMRDPVLYRSLNVPHHRTGDKFKVYPTYDFACPLLDSKDGITHIFRSKEYCERDDQMKFILSKLNMRIPKAITYGRLGIEGGVLSKREIKKGIEYGIYTGWDDKKLFTYRGMKNRGISLEGLNKFLDDVGFPESSIKIQQQKIFTINSKVIDKVSTRLIAIEKNDITEINVTSNEARSEVVKTISNFIGNQNLGKRDVKMTNKIFISKKELDEFDDDEEITIIYIGNAFYRKDTNSLELNLSGDPKKTSKKILWLNPNNCTDISLEMLDNSTKDMLIESYIDNIKDKEYMQLNKMGYFYRRGNILAEVSS